MERPPHLLSRILLVTPALFLAVLLVLPFVAMIAMMLFWTVLDVVIMLSSAHAANVTSEKAQQAWVEGISAILNQWGLGLLALTLAAFAVAVGTYRADARQLRALRQ